MQVDNYLNAKICFTWNSQHLRRYSHSSVFESNAVDGRRRSFRNPSENYLTNHSVLHAMSTNRTRDELRNTLLSGRSSWQRVASVSTYTLHYKPQHTYFVNVICVAALHLWCLLLVWLPVLEFRGAGS